MIYIGIDPGTESSALVEYDAETHTIASAVIRPNPEIEALLFEYPKLACSAEVARLAVEEIQSYGKPVSSTVFRTVFWSGRFCAAWDAEVITRGKLVPRRKVKSYFALSGASSDASIRKALESAFPATGLDSKKKPSSFGTKKAPGPLYGVTKDALAALAVAITAHARWEKLETIPGVG